MKKSEIEKICCEYASEHDYSVDDAMFCIYNHYTENPHDYIKDENIISYLKFLYNRINEMQKEIDTLKIINK